MDSRKYIGLDVHQASISVAVRDDAGKVVMESVIETKAGTILEFIRGLRGTLYVAFEEGTSAAWLHDLLEAPRGPVGRVRSAEERASESRGQERSSGFLGSSASCCARDFSRRCTTEIPGYAHYGELSRSYPHRYPRSHASHESAQSSLSKLGDYRAQEQKVYSPRHRIDWLGQLSEAGVRRRAEQLYLELDGLVQIRRQARRELPNRKSEAFSPSAPPANSPVGSGSVSRS